MYESHMIKSRFSQGSGFTYSSIFFLLDTNTFGDNIIALYAYDDSP